MPRISTLRTYMYSATSPEHRGTTPVAFHSVMAEGPQHAYQKALQIEIGLRRFNDRTQIHILDARDGRRVW